MDLGAVLAQVGSAPPDAAAAELLDAAERVLCRFGLTRWSMEDVATDAGVGRTTLYRAFASRDELVHAVLARELRTTLGAIAQAAAAHAGVEDQVVAAMVTALTALRGSVVDRLLHTDPGTFLPFLTTGAGPLLAIARDALAAQLRLLDPNLDADLAAELGEAAARLGLSFVLTRDTVVPLDDPVAAVAAVRRLLAALLPALAAGT